MATLEGPCGVFAEKHAHDKREAVRELHGVENPFELSVMLAAGVVYA
jgi:hypothetical protein